MPWRKATQEVEAMQGMAVREAARAFYKERTSPPLCLTRITIRTIRTIRTTRMTYTHDDGFLPSGLRPIDTLLLLPSF